MKINAIKGNYNVKGRFEDKPVNKPVVVVFRGCPQPTSKNRKLDKFL